MSGEAVGKWEGARWQARYHSPAISYCQFTQLDAATCFASDGGCWSLKSDPLAAVHGIVTVHEFHYISDRHRELLKMVIRF